jgi:hypothetical protein
MLYVESRISNGRVEAAERLELMNRLQAKGLVPLIRSTRLSCYDTALLGSERAADMEGIVSAWTNAEGDAPYIVGDVFCLEDFALFLIFNDAANDEAGMRAGIIYEAEMQEPERKLEAFCRNVSTALQWKPSASTDDAEVVGQEAAIVEWHLRVSPSEENTQASFNRFVAARVGDNSAAPVKENGKRQSSTIENARALELLNDAETRRALRRIREKHADGSIKEHTCFIKERVLRAAQHAFALIHMRVTLRRLFKRYGEILGETRNIALLDADALVQRTAKCRTLCAIEMDARLIVLNCFHRILLCH